MQTIVNFSAVFPDQGNMLISLFSAVLQLHDTAQKWRKHALHNIVFKMSFLIYENDKIYVYWCLKIIIELI